MRIVLIPGLDGTGLLFEELLASLPSHYETSVVDLNVLAENSYEGQSKEIAQIIAGNEVFLVGESYSGRIVYELCLLLGTKVKGVVFLASFISNPSFLSKIARYFTSIIFKENIVSSIAINLLGFNGSGTRQNIQAVFISLNKANSCKLKIRLRNIANLEPPSKSVECFATYVQPDHDFLVSKKCVGTIERLFKQCKIFRVKGGHFIAQSNPSECAQIIVNATHM